MMGLKEELQELLEEHAPNLEVLDYISPESFKNLYCSLVANLDNALKGGSE